MMATLRRLREELAAAEAGVKEAVRVRDAALEALSAAESQVPLGYYEVVSAAPTSSTKRRRRSVLVDFGEVDVSLISASALLESRQLSGGDRWPPSVTAPSTEDLAEGQWATLDPPLGGAPSVLVGDTLLVHKTAVDARMILVVRNGKDTFASALRFCPGEDSTPTAHLDRLCSKPPPPKQQQVVPPSGGATNNVASLLLRQLASAEPSNPGGNNGAAAAGGQTPHHHKKDNEDQQRRPNNSIFIGNITRGAIRDVELSLRQHFGRCGRIVDMRIAETYAHIDFDDVSAATRAKELNGTVLGSRRIRVDYADQRRGNSKSSANAAASNHHDRYGPPRRGGQPKQQMPPHQHHHQHQTSSAPYHPYQPSLQMQPSSSTTPGAAGYSAPGNNYHVNSGGAPDGGQRHLHHSPQGAPSQHVNQQPFFGGGFAQQDELDAYM